MLATSTSSQCSKAKVRHRARQHQGSCAQVNDGCHQDMVCDESCLCDWLAVQVCTSATGSARPFVRPFVQCKASVSDQAQSRRDFLAKNALAVVASTALVARYQYLALPVPASRMHCICFPSIHPQRVAQSRSFIDDGSLATVSALAGPHLPTGCQKRQMSRCALHSKQRSSYHAGTQMQPGSASGVRESQARSSVLCCPVL